MNHLLIIIWVRSDQMSMLCDGLKSWEQFIGLHGKHVEDDVDDRIVPWEGRCEAEVWEKTKQLQIKLTHGATMELTWGQLRSSLWAME